MATKPVAHAEIECAAPDCTARFTPKRSTARYHTATCQRRAARARKAAESNAAAEAKSDTPAEHALVRAVRKELEGAKAVDTVPGQLALQAARRIANPDETGFAAMSKELRSLLAEAKAGAASAPAAPDNPDPEPDEVTRARQRREEIAAAAASGAES